MRPFFLIFCSFIALFIFSNKLIADESSKDRLLKEWRLKSYYSNVKYHIKNSQWEQAMYMVQKILEIDPKDAKAKDFLKLIEKKRWEGFKLKFHDNIITRKTIGNYSFPKDAETFGETPITLQTEASKYYILGSRCFMRGDIDKALEYLKMALNYSPMYASVYRIMGEIFFIKGDDEKVSYSFDKAIESGVNNPLNYLYFGNYLIIKKDYSEALKVLEKGIKADTESEIASLCRALEYRIDRQKMLEGLRKAQKMDDDRFLTFTHEQEKKLVYFSKAEQYFIQKALNVNPDFWFSYYLMAYAYMNSYKKDKAIAYIEKASKKSPKAYKTLLDNVKYEFSKQRVKSLQFDSLEFHLAKAELLYNKKFYNDAISEIIIALGIAPGSPKARLMLGKCYSKLKNYNRAISQFRQALSLDPKLAEGYFCLGKEYLRTHQNEDAIDSLKNAILLDKGMIEAYLSLGEAYFQGEDYLSAMETYKRAIDIKKDLPEAYLNMGVIYTEQSEFDKAIESFETAIKYKDNYVDAYVNLGIVYFKIYTKKDKDEYLDKAIKYTQEALNIDPENEVIKDYLSFYKSKSK